MTVLNVRELPDQHRLEAEVVVVGAGPAGVLVALELGDAGHDVLLLESGSPDSRAEAQNLGDTVGEDPRHVPMHLATLRGIGGASNLWGGRCVPFDPIDFEVRSIAPDAKWPVSYGELVPYFQRACDWLVCGQAQFDASEVPALAKRTLVPGFTDGDIRASALERWSLPTNFATEYGDRLRQSLNVTVVTGLTCTEIVCQPAGNRVRHLVARNANGQTFRVGAGKYVLACGGLETTRLLLASKHAGTAVGNHSGHLGRWYMAHVGAQVAKVHFSTPPSDTIYGHEQDADGVYVRRRFTLAPELQNRESLSNTAFWLVNPKLGEASHESGILSFVYLMLLSPLGRHLIAEAIRKGHTELDQPGSIRKHLGNIVRDIGPTLRFAFTFGYERFLRPGRKAPGFAVPSAANVYPLVYHGEHLPSSESLVRLSSVVDQLGMPRLETHLHFSEADVRNVQRAHLHLDQALRSQGAGFVQFDDEDVDAAVERQLLGGFHQAGTTRMSDAPGDGVVDSQLAVHGFDDLFVASSSTFVTSSQANSTFMIIVFALRLADHLRVALAAGPAVGPRIADAA